MNVYQKLMAARLKLQNTDLKKSGHNKFAGYKYFELGDFLPTVQNIFNELDYINPSLYKLEFIGEEKVESNNCNKIKATLINGFVENLYYDKTTFLLTKSEKILNTEKNSFSTTYYSNYKRFKNLTYFTEMKFGENGNVQIAKIVKLLYNEKITEKDFE